MQEEILLVQFRTDASASHEQRCIFKAAGKAKSSFKILNAFDSGINFADSEKIMTGINKVILGGSGEFYFSGNKIIEKDKQFWRTINKITPFVKYLLERDVPTLGICFGHQLLAYNLGVKITNDEVQQETGSFPVFLTKAGCSSFLFRGLPNEFIAQLGHRDSLACLPKGAVLLAKNNKCGVQGFRYKRNVYGLQFHPELTLKDVIYKLKLYPDYTYNKRLEDVIKKLKSSPYPAKILKNFCAV